jgi:aldehyde dehydrogenase (NAD+)
VAIVAARTDQLTSVNPARWNDVIEQAPSLDAQAVGLAAGRVRASKVSRSPSDRAGALRQLAKDLRSAKQRLADLLVREVGKLPAEAGAEVLFSAAIADHYAQLLDDGATSAERDRPVDLAGVVTPFNFPCSIAVMKAAAAYGAGSPVLWKPSPHAIGVSAALLRLLRGALGPVVELVITDNLDAFAEVARQVDALSYTGGTQGASILWNAVVQRPIPMQLELGSCNATVIGRDYPIDAAVRILRISAFSYAGQKCSSTRRILVERERRHALFEALSASLMTEVVGDPLDRRTTIPPLIAPTSAERFRRQMRGWASGAERQISIDVSDELTDCFVEPQLSLATADAGPLRAEVFGPAAVVIPYADFDQALNLANATPFGLFAGLLTQDAEEAARFEAEARVGIIKINQTTTGLTPDLPSQGWGGSGLGPSELGNDPFRPFLRVKTVYPFQLLPGS